MDETEIQSLRTDLDTIRKDVDQIKKDNKTILRCLQGNLDDSMHGELGLVPEHRVCREKVKQLLDDVSSLKDYKRDVIAWAGGAAAALIVVWELARTYLIK